MPATDLSLLLDAAQTAGTIATRFTGPTAQRWDKPDDAGPVTEADLAVDTYLRDRLLAARPSYGWLSEETADTPDRLTKSRVFIIDPIDGTRAFIEGSPDWAHSLAIAENGVITAAVVYLPQKSMTFAAARGQGATLNGKTVTASTLTDLSQATVLANKLTMADGNWAVPPTFKRAFRSSLAYRMSLIAQGRFDAMLTLRPTWEWDIAAGTLLVTEAGGQATTRTGAPLLFNNPTPQLNGVVAAGGTHAPLIAALAQPA